MKKSTKEMTEERAIEILLGGGGTEIPEEERKEAIDLAVSCIRQREKMKVAVKYHDEERQRADDCIVRCEALKADYDFFKIELNDKVHKVYESMDKQIKEMEKIPSWHRVRGLNEAKEFLKIHLSKLEKETAYRAEKLTRDTIKKLAKAREKYETAEYMDDRQAY